MKKKYKGFGSACIHSGVDQNRSIPSHMEAIYPTSTYSYDNAEDLIEIFKGNKEGYVYSRWNNPTFESAEAKISALESYQLKDSSGNDLQLKTKLFSSGMGAISALLLSNLFPNDSIIAQGTLYGGTAEFIGKILKPLHINAHIIDLKNLSLVEDLCKKDSSVKMIYIETPANPTIDCYDIEALSAIGKKYNKLIAVDNTFATPYLQQAFKYDVDFVVHSTTKYLNGHGNAIGGALVAKDFVFMKSRLHEVIKLIGSNANPFDAWLLAQGIKTLELRMDRHCNNAMKLAQYLSNNSSVLKTNYCGLTTHVDHEVAKKQMRNFGGMLSFELKNGIEAGKKFIKQLQLSTLAVSLGTVDTIVQHPASMSHVRVDKATREQYGITDGLIRASVGIENVEDLIEDFETALQGL